jgi:selenoprotein W-related protein
MAQELLTTFETGIGEVALIPGTGGIFEVRLDEETIFSRKEQGRFPESKELKQLVRDRISPEKDLGHSDRREPSSKDVAPSGASDAHAPENRSE